MDHIWLRLFGTCLPLWFFFFTYTALRELTFSWVDVAAGVAEELFCIATVITAIGTVWTLRIG